MISASQVDRAVHFCLCEPHAKAAACQPTTQPDVELRVSQGRRHAPTAASQNRARRSSLTSALPLASLSDEQYTTSVSRGPRLSLKQSWHRTLTVTHYD